MKSLDVLVGQQLDGKYQLEGLIGRGGMGAVFRARHLGTERQVALKVISPELTSHPEAIGRFEREARAAGRLQHPNVVNVTDFGVASTEEGSIAYLVMEHLSGFTLGELLARETRLALSSVVDIIEQVSLALQAAHSQGVIHRDIKPDNIWLEPDPRGGYKVKVLDFGVAKLRDEQDRASIAASRDSGAPDVPSTAGDDHTIVHPRADETATLVRDHSGPTGTGAQSSSPAITVAGSVIGTPAYMSPEQCRGDALDPRSDIYSLGVVAYQMLTGERPFTGNTVQLISMHLNDSPPDLHGKRSDLPEGVTTLVMSAMSKDPQLRPSTAIGLAGALRVHAEGPSILLRRGVSLAVDRLDLMGRLWLFPAAVIPVVAAPLGLGALFLSRSALLWLVCVASFVAMSMIAASSMGLFSTAAARLRQRPLEIHSCRDVLDDLKNRLGTSRDANVVRVLLVCWKRSVRCGWHTLRTRSMKSELVMVVSIMERLAPRDAALRTSALARQLPKTLGFTRSIMMALFGVVGFVVGVRAGRMVFADDATEGLSLLSAEGFAFAVNAFLPFIASATALLPFIALAVFPFFSLAMTLYYFSARQAAGEEDRLVSLNDESSQGSVPPVLAETG
ncbi:MAG: serine/threonine protein kinase [Acidobacteria bacterium]|nr:serine/threonine protein kinase [Acidobacteriota bacterium]